MTPTNNERADFPSLYERTGDITDINTLLVPRADLAANAPAAEPLIARQLGEWHEEDGPVVWWAWNGRTWAGEPGWIGTPLDEGWPDYHTHWTPHPAPPDTAAKGAT